MSKLVRAGVPIALLSAILLAGCGGDGSGETSPPTDSRGSGFEGGERDVEEFGAEAHGSDKDEVLAAEREYLKAVAAGRFDQACTRLSRSVVSSMQQMTRGGENPDCASILAQLLASGAAAGAVGEQVKGEVVRVRVEGRQAFVVFHAPGARLWVMPMSRDDDGWRAATISATVLAPSATTLGE